MPNFNNPAEFPSPPNQPKTELKQSWDTQKVIIESTSLAEEAISKPFPFKFVLIWLIILAFIFGLAYFASIFLKPQ